MSPRIQRLIVRALPYNFHIVYVSGKLIPMTDALSRNLKNYEDKEENQISLQILAVNYVTRNYQHYPDKPVIDQIREGTSKDATLQLLTNTSEMVGLWIERNFQRNYTLTGIIEMNFPWRNGIQLKSYSILIPYTL